MRRPTLRRKPVAVDLWVPPGVEQLQRALRDRGMHAIADSLLLAALEPQIVNALRVKGSLPEDIMSQVRVVIGTIASGVADDGSEPNKVGGVYKLTKPTFGDGQRVEAQFGAKGALTVQLVSADATNAVAAQAPADAISAGLSSLNVLSFGELFNGSGWDRMRSVTALADNAASTGLLAAQQYVHNGAGYDRLKTPNVFKSIVNLVVVTGTPQAIWTPAAGKKFRLMGGVLVGTAATKIKFLDAAGDTQIRVPVGPDTGPSTAMPWKGNGYLSAVANNALNVDVSGNSTLNGYVFGTEE